MHKDTKKPLLICGEEHDKNEVKEMLLTSSDITYFGTNGLFMLVSGDIKIKFENPNFRCLLSSNQVRDALHKYMFGNKAIDPTISFYYFNDLPALVNSEDNRRMILHPSILETPEPAYISGTFEGKPLEDIKITGDDFSSSHCFFALITVGLIAVSEDGSFIAMKFIDREHLRAYEKAGELLIEVDVALNAAANFTGTNLIPPLGKK